MTETNSGLSDGPSMAARCQAVSDFRPPDFGDAPSSIWLSECAGQTPRVANKAAFQIEANGDYEIIVDEADEAKLEQLLRDVVTRRPRFVLSYPDGEAYRTVLKNRHVALLRHVPYISLPRHSSITDACLIELKSCRAICLAACKNITLENIVDLGMKYDGFYRVKLWGYGAEFPPSDHFKEAVSLGLLKH